MTFFLLDADLIFDAELHSFLIRSIEDSQHPGGISNVIKQVE